MLQVMHGRYVLRAIGRGLGGLGATLGAGALGSRLSAGARAPEGLTSRDMFAAAGRSPPPAAGRGAGLGLNLIPAAQPRRGGAALLGARASGFSAISEGVEEDEAASTTASSVHTLGSRGQGLGLGPGIGPRNRGLVGVTSRDPADLDPEAWEGEDGRPASPVADHPGLQHGAPRKTAARACAGRRRPPLQTPGVVLPGYHGFLFNKYSFAGGLSQGNKEPRPAMPATRTCGCSTGYGVRLRLPPGATIAGERLFGCHALHTICVTALKAQATTKNCTAVSSVPLCFGEAGPACAAVSSAPP